MEQIRLVFVVFVLLFSAFSTLVVPFPIKDSSIKLNVKDKNLQNTEAHVLNKERLNKEGKNVHGSTLDDPETTMSESNLGLRLFPVISKLDSDRQLDSHVEQSTKPPFPRFFPIPQEQDKQGQQGVVGNDSATIGRIKGDEDDYLEDYDGPPPKKGDHPDPRSNNLNIGGGTTPTIPTEKTISMPKFKTDYLGNWVNNPWAVTYAQMFRDTRFIGPKYPEPVHFDKRTRLYNPYIVPTKTVCKKESTGYNFPHIKKYLRQAFWKYTPYTRHVLEDLRKAIYKAGKSEECHTPQQLNWRIFNECQMMRNMRMEYLVPYYPLIQTMKEMDYQSFYDSTWWYDEDPVATTNNYLTYNTRWKPGTQWFN